MPDEQQLTDDERATVQTACLYALTQRVAPTKDSDHDLLISALRKISGVDKVVVVRRG